MDKENKIKTLSVIAIVAGILGITVAFALVARSIVIRGESTMSPAVWDIHFKNISSPTIKGKASVITAPTIGNKGASINNLEVRLKEPQDKIEYTVYIENSGDINAKIDDITYPTLTPQEDAIFKFSARYYSNNSPMQVGDTLKAGQIKQIKITIEYKDIDDKNLLPTVAKTINIDFRVLYVQDNNTYVTTTGSSLLPDGYKECEYIESTGTQYINTLYYPKIDTKVEMDLSFNGTFKTTGASIMGSTDSNYNEFSINFGGGASQNETIFMWFNKSYGHGGVIRSKRYSTDTLYNRNTMVLDRLTGQTLYGATSFSVYGATGDVNGELIIFGSYAGTPFQAYNMRLYRFKIYNGNILKKDLIPALDDNNRPCMYDAITDNTFYNQGTGEFNYQLK